MRVRSATLPLWLNNHNTCPLHAHRLRRLRAPDPRPALPVFLALRVEGRASGPGQGVPWAGSICGRALRGGPSVRRVLRPRGIELDAIEATDGLGPRSSIGNHPWRVSAPLWSIDHNTSEYGVRVPRWSKGSRRLHGGVAWRANVKYRPLDGVGDGGRGGELRTGHEDLPGGELEEDPHPPRARLLREAREVHPGPGGEGVRGGREGPDLREGDPHPGRAPEGPQEEGADRPVPPAEDRPPRVVEGERRGGGRLGTRNGRGGALPPSPRHALACAGSRVRCDP